MNIRRNIREMISPHSPPNWQTKIPKNTERKGVTRIVNNYMRRLAGDPCRCCLHLLHDLSSQAACSMVLFPTSSVPVRYGSYGLPAQPDLPMVFLKKKRKKKKRKKEPN